MKYLGTEVGQFGGFLEVQLMNWCCFVDNARIVVVHTVNVCPNLNFVGTDGSTDERGGIVGTATQQVVDLSVGVSTDESLSYIYLLSLVLLHDGCQFFLDVHEVGLGILVSTHEVEGSK